MGNIGDQIKKARTKRNLSISELSNATSIRSHIIQAIESGDHSVLPEVYMKSFVRTLLDYFDIQPIIENKPEIQTDETKAKPTEKKIEPAPKKPAKLIIDDAEPIIETSKQSQSEIVAPSIDEIKFIDSAKPVGIFQSKIEKNKEKNDKAKPKVSFDDEALPVVAKGDMIDPIQLSASVPAETDYSDLFKRKKVSSGISPSLVNYLAYGGVALIIIIAIYFTFFFNSSPFSSKTNGQTADKTADSSIVDVDNSLFDYFSEADTLSLTVRSSDTAWLKMEVDGKTSEEILMLPGMDRSWTAGEFFTVHQGNIGALKFYRNGELLEPFGRRGTVVKNVKITRTEILSDAPWQEDPTTKFDAVEGVPKETKRYKSTKKKEPEKVKIEPSKIEPQKPTLLQPKKPSE